MSGLPDLFNPQDGASYVAALESDAEGFARSAFAAAVEHGLHPGSIAFENETKQALTDRQRLLFGGDEARRACIPHAAAAQSVWNAAAHRMVRSLTAEVGGAA